MCCRALKDLGVEKSVIGNAHGPFGAEEGYTCSSRRRESRTGKWELESLNDNTQLEGAEALRSSLSIRGFLSGCGVGRWMGIPWDSPSSWTQGLFFSTCILISSPLSSVNNVDTTPLMFSASLWMFS